MPEGYPSQEFDNATVIRKVIELARLGERDSSGLLTARYASCHVDVELILTTLIDERIYKCAAVIQYSDGTDYDISWQNGNVWSLSHTDIDYESNLDRLLPFSGGRLRGDYKSQRVITPDEEASAILDLQNTIDTFADSHGDEGISIPTIDDIAKYTDGIMNDPRYKDVFDAFEKAFVDVDPADIDLSALCQPILEINPVTDRISLR